MLMEGNLGESQRSSQNTIEPGKQNNRQPAFAKHCQLNVWNIWDLRVICFGRKSLKQVNNKICPREWHIYENFKFVSWGKDSTSIIHRIIFHVLMKIPKNLYKTSWLEHSPFQSSDRDTKISLWGHSKSMSPYKSRFLTPPPPLVTVCHHLP